MGVPLPGREDALVFVAADRATEPGDDQRRKPDGENLDQDGSREGDPSRGESRELLFDAAPGEEFRFVGRRSGLYAPRETLLPGDLRNAARTRRSVSLHVEQLTGQAAAAVGLRRAALV